MQGYWRVPWSKGNNTFARCPYEADCLGEPGENITEKCLPGTSGPLCSICIEGYNRDGGTCSICSDNSVPLRIGILVGIIIVLVVIVLECRKRVNKKLMVYRPLWSDFLRVVSINITFAQINSSLPTVLDIQWPPEWHRFVQKFAFVNIDLMSLIGISCIGDYDYYLSFAVMVCMPISILIFAIVHYHYAKIAMKRRLRILVETDKKNMEEEALHSLFHLAAAEKKVAQSQGMASSPVATNTTVGSPHLADGGAHKTMRLTATVEGNTTEGTVTLLATPAGGSEDASCEKQRKRKNDRLVCGLQKRLTHQAFEGYLTPKHDAIPEHFVWPVGGRKDRLAQLTLELSGRSAMPVIAEEGAASHDSILRITGENGAATGTSLVVEEPHGELVL